MNVSQDKLKQLIKEEAQNLLNEIKPVYRIDAWAKENPEKVAQLIKDYKRGALPDAKRPLAKYLIRRQANEDMISEQEELNPLLQPLKDRADDEAARYMASQLGKDPKYRTGRIVPGTEGGREDIRARLENLKDIENAMQTLGSERPEDIPKDLLISAATELAGMGVGGLATRGLMKAFPKTVDFLRRSMSGPVGKGVTKGPFKQPVAQPYATPTAAKAEKLAKQIRYPARPEWMPKALYKDIRPFLFTTGKPGTALANVPRPAANKAFGKQVGGQFVKPQVVPAYIPGSSLPEENPGAQDPSQRFDTPEFVPPIPPPPRRGPVEEPISRPRMDIEETLPPPKEEFIEFPPMYFKARKPKPKPKPAPLTPRGGNIEYMNLRGDEYPTQPFGTLSESSITKLVNQDAAEAIILDEVKKFLAEQNLPRARPGENRPPMPAAAGKASWARRNPEADPPPKPERRTPAPEIGPVMQRKRMALSDKEGLPARPKAGERGAELSQAIGSVEPPARSPRKKFTPDFSKFPKPAERQLPTKEKALKDLGQTPRKKSGKTFKIPPVKIPSSVQDKSSVSSGAPSGKAVPDVFVDAVTGEAVSFPEGTGVQYYGSDKRGRTARSETSRRLVVPRSEFKKGKYSEKINPRSSRPVYKKTSKKELEEVIREEVENHLIEKLKASK